MLFAGAGVFFPMLLDELRQLVFGDGFFEVHVSFFFDRYVNNSSGRHIVRNYYNCASL